MDYYRELFLRNSPIITEAQQQGVAEIKLAVAGCGSTGGGFTDGALRLGVKYFKLADLGRYELNNLNRQMVETKDINENKAVAYGRRIKSVNPVSFVEVYDEGLTRQNLDRFLDDCTLVFDAVDVTTEAGIEMKLKLHEETAKRRLPVASALDLGFTQWIKGYNYQAGDVVLEGKLDAARRANHPLKALIKGFVDVEELPLEITEEIIRLMTVRDTSACQLGAACFLLSAMTTPYFLYFLEKKRVPPLVKIDLLAPFLSEQEKSEREKHAMMKRKELQELLNS